jgi:hypothetical protein
MNLSFCSGYRKVNLLITRCLEPDSIALIIPAADDVGFVNFVILLYHFVVTKEGTR